MARNPSWWGTAEYAHNIDRIVHTYKSDEENLAALLDGEIDLLVARSTRGSTRSSATPI
jgi:ABC-type transport system substrate-binding protein